jgi:hypothetical protein
MLCMMSCVCVMQPLVTFICACCGKVNKLRNKLGNKRCCPGPNITSKVLVCAQVADFNNGSQASQAAVRQRVIV